MADISVRTEGMVGASADYYQESEIFKAIQNAQALEYDRIERNNEDIALQLSPLTATWGLDFWEEGLGLPIIRSADYESRRPAVLAKLAAKNENFNVEMIRAYSQAYGKPCTVSVDVQNSAIEVIFIEGIPKLYEQLKKDIEQIIHAHLGVTFRLKFTHKTLSGYTHAEIAAYTHDQLIQGVNVEGVI